jgi:aryl-alcohol dehydrogenase-like predicted oxidoreductase
MMGSRQTILSRRTFLKLGLSGAAAAVVASLWPRIPKVAAAPQPLPTRTLGKTGVPVSILGLGGEGVLRTNNRDAEAIAVIRQALAQGITYCDSAPAYSSSQDYYGQALGEDRKRIFLASKTHERTRDGSLRLLDDSLKRLRTDHLDLWQLHDLRDMEELDVIFGKQGAIHALEQARADGRVRFFGITGHHDPAVLSEALRRYPFDTALVSLNVADRHRLSFIENVLPAANQAQMGIIGMKVLARGALAAPGSAFGLSKSFGYALSLPISTAIIGFGSPAEVDEAAALARQFKPMPAEEMARLETLAKPLAQELSWYKRS